MEFSWDAAKSAENYRVRGFDFAFASLIFNGPTLEREDRRQDYAETRIVAIGLADGIELTIVFTDRPGSARDIVRRIISARRSNRRERTAFQASLKAS